MKLIKTASGKKQIKISKKEWERIGKQAGWVEAQGRMDRNEEEMTSTTGEPLESAPTTSPISLGSVIEDIEVYLSTSAGWYDEANEAEVLLEEALGKLRECKSLMSFRFEEKPEGWE